jgi:large subunit ribosomal protein L23
MNDPYAIIKMPLLSEKSDRMKEAENKIVLKVDRRANKTEIKKAVEILFKVKVKDINIINMKGKRKKLGQREGKRSDWKKAIATLAQGETVDFIEGV